MEQTKTQTLLFLNFVYKNYVFRKKKILFWVLTNLVLSSLIAEIFIAMENMFNVCLILVRGGVQPGSRCQRRFSAFFWMRWNYVWKALNPLKCAENLKRRWKFKTLAHLQHTSYIILVHFVYNSCKSFSTFFQRKFRTRRKISRFFLENVETTKF